MKTINVCFLIFGVCLVFFLALCRPNFLDHTALNTTEGLSRWLRFTLQFHPAQGTEEARFAATLTNVSTYILSLELNDKQFHARLMVKLGTGQSFEIMDRDYRDMLMTSIWSDPTIYLAPSKSVTWICL